MAWIQWADMQAKSSSVISCVAWIQWADMQAKSSKCHIMCVPGYSGLICKQSLAVSYRVCAWIQWADMQAKSSSVISCVCLDTVG